MLRACAWGCGCKCKCDVDGEEEEEEEDAVAVLAERCWCSLDEGSAALRAMFLSMLGSGYGRPSEFAKA